MFGYGWHTSWHTTKYFSSFWRTLKLLQISDQPSRRQVSNSGFPRRNLNLGATGAMRPVGSTTLLSEGVDETLVRVFKPGSSRRRWFRRASGGTRPSTAVAALSVLQCNRLPVADLAWPKQSTPACARSGGFPGRSRSLRRGALPCARTRLSGERPTRCR